MSSTLLPGFTLSFVLGLLVLVPETHVWAQEAETSVEADPASSQVDQMLVDQMLVDLDALVVSIAVTTRCALHDGQIQYLTPLEQVGAAIRLGEMTTALGSALDDLPDRMARMHTDAAAIACGHEDLAPYMDFGRQVGRDVIDIALLAWRGIEIDRCNYFADDDFMGAVDRAQNAAMDWPIEGPDNRRAYIERQAETWITLFAQNCANLGFDPVPTLPGEIALALPLQPS